MPENDFERAFIANANSFMKRIGDYNGEIYNSEMKELKRRFERTIEMPSRLSPQEYLLRGHDNDMMEMDIPPDRRSEQAELFSDVYYANWSLHGSGSILKKLARINPRGPLEREVLDTLTACAEKLHEADVLVKSQKLLPGRRPPLEEWQKRPEPNKFTCSCCFRRQARNPAAPGKVADHGFVKAGYRKGVCDGANFPPLESSGVGNLAFLEAARREYCERSEEIIEVLKTPPASQKERNARFDMFRELFETAREISRRNIIAEGMKETGSYAGFLEKGYDRAILGKSYDRFAICEAERILEEGNPEEMGKIPSRLEFFRDRMGAERPECGSEGFRYLLEEWELRSWELFALLDIHSRSGEDQAFLDWVRDNLAPDLPQGQAPRM